MSAAWDDGGALSLELEAAWRSQHPEAAARLDAERAALLARLDAAAAAADPLEEPF